jgi:hypothetical protein
MSGHRTDAGLCPLVTQSGHQPRSFNVSPWRCLLQLANRRDDTWRALAGVGLARDGNTPRARHSAADVQELIEHGAKAVVLSKGIWERLNVCPETTEVLAKSGIEVEVLQTEAAVERFNELRESMPVGGLFHSTC